jgi:2'-5' RNA ligase
MNRGGHERWVRLLAPGERRLFIAVPLGDGAREAVARLMTGLGAPADGGRSPDPAAPPAARLRWVRSANLHLTLRFLGATAAASIPALEAAVDRTARGWAPFEARLAGAGAFPSPARPRAVFLRVGEGAASLGALADRLAAELAAAGWPPAERPFAAHLTLARSDGVPGASEAVEALAAAASSLAAAWTVDRIVLFESLLGGGPARYVPLRIAFLDGGPLRDRGGTM